MIKAVFFDLDETLVNAERAHARATIQAFADFGYEYEEIKKKSPEHISRGMRVADNLKARRDGAGISEDSIPMEKLIATRESYFLSFLKQDIRLMKGASETLDFISKKKIITAIVTSGTKKYVDFITQFFHWESMLDFIVTGDDVKIGKPDPECYLAAFKKAAAINSELQLNDCLVVEDTEAGVRAGKKAGMKVVFVPSSGSITPSVVLPDFQIISLLELDDSVLLQ